MQTIFEVFDPAVGTTEGYKTRAAADEYINRMEKAGYVRDFSPTTRDGFYVVNMRGLVKAGPFADRFEAERKRDFENMANDYDSFSVVEHRI